MATVKMTFSLDEATAARLDDAATTLHKPKSEIVRDAIGDFADRMGQLTEAERIRLLGVFDQVVTEIPDGPVEAVESELRDIRRARQRVRRGRQRA